MKINALTVGLRVKHPQYGVGTVKSISEKSAEVRFDDGLRTVDPELSELALAEPGTDLLGLTLPMQQLVEQVVNSVLLRLGYDRPDEVIDQLGLRWHKGKAVLHSADVTAQTKEIPIEILFQKIVGLRDQLRVLENKINGHPTLSAAEKSEMLPYVSRCHGSLTTFNLLFKNKEDQFSSKGGES